MASIQLTYNNNVYSDEEDEEDELDDDACGTSFDPDGEKNVIRSIEDLPWYQGEMTRHTADVLLLSNGQEGSYLLRSSSSKPDKYSLSVKCQSSTKHYTLEYDPYIKSYMFGMGQFDTLEELVDHFHCQPVLGSESGPTVILKYPYPRNIEEPTTHDTILRHSEGLNIISSDTSPPPDLAMASKEGYLVKRGAILKNWKMRWFELQKSNLSCYKTRGSAKPISTIDLRHATNVSTDSTDNKEHCFRVCLPPRIFYFHAVSDVEAEQWMKILQWKIDYYQKKREKAVSNMQQGASLVP